MAQVKLMKISTDGVSVEMDTASDDITLNSFTIQGGGPVLSGTGLDMNNQDIDDIKDMSFNNPATGTITLTAGSFVIDDLMFESKENAMTTAGAVLFPTIADNSDEVDAFRLPTLAGAPTAAPNDGGEGYIVWDSTNNTLYAWDGSAWVNQSQAANAGAICTTYTADENLAANETVYISGADNVSKGDVSGGGAGSRLIGFTKAAASDTASVEIQSEGTLSGFTGLTAGARYFGEPGVVGGITPTLPVGTGNTIVQVGYAKSATVLHIHIEQLGRRS